MRRNRKASNGFFWTLAGHYLPVYVPYLIAFVPLLMMVFYHQKDLSLMTVVACGGIDPPASFAVLPSLSLAFVGFWIWAITINAHAGHSARHCGRKKRSVDQRNDEAAFILVALFCSPLYYIITMINFNNTLFIIALIVPLAIPPFFIIPPKRTP